LYEHYGLEYTERLTKWIEINTKGRSAQGSTYGTQRKSEVVPSQWKEMLKTEKGRRLVKIIEEKCSKMMQKLAYVPEFINFAYKLTCLNRHDYVGCLTFHLLHILSI
jgi:hypothetical protein